MYSIRLFDHNLTLVAALNGAVSASVRSQHNAAAQASYVYPGDAGEVSDFGLTRNLAVYRHDRRLFAGRITDRDVSGNDVQIRAIGHEDRLNRMRTPGQWQGWNGWDLADVARDMTNHFRMRRFVTAEDWQDAHASHDVNLSVEPGSVMLGLEPYYGGERFKEHGWIQLRANLGDEALPVGRIARWAERAGDPTRITIQSRAASTPVELDQSPWSPEMTAVNVDNVRENEVSGVLLADGGQWLDIRIHLYTQDRTSPDDQMDPQYYGRTPILDALEIIWREPSNILPGDIPQTTGHIVEDGVWDRENHLKALRDECEAAGWRFRVRHDEATRQLYLDLAESFGRDLTDDVILRHGDNAVITTLRDADAEYANVLNCWGSGSGIDRLYKQLRDEAAILDRGEEVEVDFTADTTDPAELVALGEDELERRVNAIPQFVVSVKDPSLVFDLGDTVTIADRRSQSLINDDVNELQIEYRASSEDFTLAFGGASLARAVERLMVAQRQRPRGEVAPRPAKPTNITVQGFAGGIRFWWSGRADSFEVEHTTVEENGQPHGWAPPAGTVTERRYEESGLVLGSKHWYRIRAVTAGRTSDWVVFSAIAKNIVPPATPSHFIMLGTLEGIAVNFTPPKDEDLAYVEVHLSKSADFTPTYPANDPGDWDGEANTLYDRLAKPTNVGRYDFDAGTTLYGQLVAVDTSDNRSAPTAEQTATAQEGLDMTPPDAPVLGALVDHDSVDLGNSRYDIWVSVPFTTDDKTEYIQLERRKGAGGDWVGIGQTSVSPWVDRSGLEPKTTYYYRARAYSTTGQPSSLSNTRQITIPVPVANPGIVQNVQTLAAYKRHIVTWDRLSGAPTIDRYELQYSARSEGGSWDSWKSVPGDKITSTLYSHEGLSPPLDYRYRVRAWSTFGHASVDWSTVKEAGKPGRVPGSDIDPGTLPKEAFDEPLQQARAKWDDAGEFVSDLAVQHIGPDEISQTVSQVYPDGTQQQSTIQQLANEIAMRIMATTREDIVTGRYATLPAVGTNTLASTEDDSGHPVDFEQMLAGKETVYVESIKAVDNMDDVVLGPDSPDSWGIDGILFASADVPSAVEPGMRIDIQTTYYGRIAARILDIIDVGGVETRIVTDADAQWTDEVDWVMVYGLTEVVYPVGAVVSHTSDTLTLDTDWTADNAPALLGIDRYRLYHHAMVPAAQLLLSHVDGRGIAYLLADMIVEGALTVSDVLKIINADGTMTMDGKQIEFDTGDGRARFGPAGMMFEHADGTKLGFVRGVLSGTATDGDIVTLPFTNPATVMLQPLDMLTYDPAHSKQRLQLYTVDASAHPAAEGKQAFMVYARLVSEDGGSKIHEFAKTTPYLTRRSGHIIDYCSLQTGHNPSGSQIPCHPLYSPEGGVDSGACFSDQDIIAVNASRTYVTDNNEVTAIKVNVREMMHTNAFAGNYTATNRMTYRVDVRPVGSSTWTHTTGSITRSLSAWSSTFSQGFQHRHALVSHTIDNLPPDQYEVQITMVSKTIDTAEGFNYSDSQFLIVESWEEQAYMVIQSPVPATVQWLAIETDSTFNDDDEGTDE